MPLRIRIGIETLSDLVFGLALQLGSIFLIVALPQHTKDLVNDILYFGFSFLILVVIWVGYRRTIATLPFETQATLDLNIALLFCVSLEPFLFYVVVTTDTIVDFASSVYALDLGAMLLLLAGLSYLLLAEERTGTHERVHPGLIGSVAKNMRWRFVIGVVFLVSALPVFWIASPIGNLRIDMWLACLVLTFIASRVLRLGKGIPQRNVAN